MRGTAALKPREIQVIQQINKDLTLIQMPDPDTFDFHVEGTKHYMVHFLNRKVFDQEFATLRKGDNLFTMINHGTTECYFFDDTQLREIVSGVVYARTGPIVIPPHHNPGATKVPRTGPIVIPPNRQSGG